MEFDSGQTQLQQEDFAEVKPLPGVTDGPSTFCCFQHPRSYSTLHLACHVLQRKCVRLRNEGVVLSLNPASPHCNQWTLHYHETVAIVMWGCC